MNGLIYNNDIKNNNPELNFERIQILYASVNAGYVGVSSAIAMLYFIAAHYASPRAAALWLLAVAIANLPRIIVSIRFSRRLRAGLIRPDNIAPWDRYMSISSVAAYAGFVAVIFLPFGDNTVIGTVLCAFVFMTLSTGGVLVLSTSFPQILIYLSLVIAAIVAKLLLLDQNLYAIIAIILLFGYLQLLKLTMRQNRILIENIALKIENRNSALVDPLTRLANRRRLALHAEKLVPASQRTGEPFCLVIFDIDNFKRYNDTHGHRAGDQLLIEVAGLLRDCSREQDLVVRYGGEEFLLQLPQTALADATTITERILATVKAQTPVTLSAGVAEFSGATNSFDELVGKADAALYRAKNTGRDQYILAT